LVDRKELKIELIKHGIYCAGLRERADQNKDRQGRKGYARNAKDVLALLAYPLRPWRSNLWPLCINFQSINHLFSLNWRDYGVCYGHYVDNPGLAGEKMVKKEKSI